MQVTDARKRDTDPGKLALTFMRYKHGNSKHELCMSAAPPLTKAGRACGPGKHIIVIRRHKRRRHAHGIVNRAVACSRDGKDTTQKFRTTGTHGLR